MTIARRSVLTGGAASVGLVVAGSVPSLAEASPGNRLHQQPDKSGHRPFPPLVDDPDGLLALPPGFAYTVVTYAGRTHMEDAQGLTPSNHDGTAVFDAGRGRLRLIQNHELPAGSSLGVPHVSGTVYDPTAFMGGGCTVIETDRQGRNFGEWVGISGTSTNCAGGPTPWGTWLTCEETETKAGSAWSGNGQSGTYSKDHGYVLEVFDDGQAVPEPIKAFGRYAHEALAVDPSRTRVYLSEDASNPNGLFYRWTAPRGLKLGPGIADKLGDTAGSLEAMAMIMDDGSVLPDVAYLTSAQLGRPFPVRWVEVPERDGQTTSVRKQFTNEITRGKKFEGVFGTDKGVYVVNSFAFNTGDLPVDAVKRDGMVWFYSYADETITLVTYFPHQTTSDTGGAPRYDGVVFDGPDNVTVTPWGTLVLAEDGIGASHVLSSVPGGPTYAIARNQLNIGTPAAPEYSEFTGPTFPPTARCPSSTSRPLASRWRSPGPGRSTWADAWTCCGDVDGRRRRGSRGRPSAGESRMTPDVHRNAANWRGQVLAPRRGAIVTLTRSALAPPARTLVAVFRETVAEFPDADALDNGVELLTYSEFSEDAESLAAELNAMGIGRGDRVGVRVTSGTTDLYVAIMGILTAGAAYVPVDADDPDERARLVFGEAKVAAVVGNGLTIANRRPGRPPCEPESPEPSDDAWIIFTSGSTGTPKGVAVSHRSAAAFVDAESRMFLQSEPVGETDRVMAGLSVAFDASCEEMWLAWAHGACLFPAPRSLVRTGVDVGPWLVANRITVVSTVPTLVALWPTESLAAVRLLIMGGEACPPEIGARLAGPEREVWNTYGPTEATVVACGARLTGEGPVRIGLPLDGWDLAVVDEGGQPVAVGEVGELIIGGVGLARYLDPQRDAEKYGPFPTLGWERAYRSGDRVVHDPDGLLFAGRADDQIKLGGRRIELGEIDSALLSLPNVVSAAAAVRRSRAGNELLVGYVTVTDRFDPAAALARLREAMPASLVPRLAQVERLPTRTSGKVDREALPWPLVAAEGVSTPSNELSGTSAWIADIWLDVLGADVSRRKDDFFELGGGSLTAAQVVSRLRERFPEVTVADLYENPTVGKLAGMLDDMATPATLNRRQVRPTPTKTQWGQLVFAVPLRLLSGLRWLTWIAGANNVASTLLGLSYLPTVSWGWVVVGWLLFVFAPGRMALTVVGARLLLHRVAPGEYPRGGKVHLRLWLAERLADELGAANLAGAAWMPSYARALGATVGEHVDLHSIPPVTGMLTLGDGCSIEPEVDLTGHWLDGDVLHIGSMQIGPGARIGTRSTLFPGAVVGRNAEVAPGSAVLGKAIKGEFWTGSPAEPVGKTRGPWSASRPLRKPVWVLAYAAVAVVISLFPVVAVIAGLLVALSSLQEAESLGGAALVTLAYLPLATLVALVVLAVLILVLVRLLAVGLEPGAWPIHSRHAWQPWATMRVLDEARTWLFPLYSSFLTPRWLRLLGAKIGERVEASTVLLIPALTTVNDEAFLADDTLLGSYELGGGWLRVERTKVGKRAFVGNSGMAAPGRKVPKQSLVAVLSAAPRRKKAKAGSSWLGSPPVLLRRSHDAGDTTRTYDPPRRLEVARASVEVARLLAVMASAALGGGVVLTLELILDSDLPWLALIVAGPLLMLAGAVGAGLATVVKWLLVGRVTPTEHPLWSSFVWRSELADSFVEVVAAPWFARAATGTPALNLWLRSLGARIGRGVWCETYWLPEPDLVELQDGATVNQGCVVQTHLFHDRVLSMDRVVLRTGATLGPNSVILPASTVGRHATVGPVSLVMRGESVPDKTSWIGNPIGPWLDEDSHETAT